MPTTKLIPIRSYVEPTIFERMERVRTSLRRITKSRFVEDAILEKVERMEDSRPIPFASGTRKRATG